MKVVKYYHGIAENQKRKNYNKNLQRGKQNERLTRKKELKAKFFCVYFYLLYLKYIFGGKLHKN